jgi:hypothetical protein
VRVWSLAGRGRRPWAASPARLALCPGGPPRLASRPARPPRLVPGRPASPGARPARLASPRLVPGPPASPRARLASCLAHFGPPPLGSVHNAATGEIALSSSGQAEPACSREKCLSSRTGAVEVGRRRPGRAVGPRRCRAGAVGAGEVEAGRRRPQTGHSPAVPSTPPPAPKTAGTAGLLRISRIAAVFDETCCFRRVTAGRGCEPADDPAQCASDPADRVGWSRQPRPARRASHASRGRRTAVG